MEVVVGEANTTELVSSGKIDGGVNVSTIEEVKSIAVAVDVSTEEVLGNMSEDDVGLVTESWGFVEFLVSIGRQMNELHVYGTTGPQRCVGKRAAWRVC